MPTINLNTQQGVKFLLFPDNQPHVVLDHSFRSTENVFCSITDSNKLLQLCMVADVLNRAKAKWNLHIPYLMGARMDRVIKDGESFDLKVICNIINSLKAEQICLYDPHSDVAPALIENSYVYDNSRLVKIYDKEKAVLIVPDAGAVKKAHNYLEWNKNLNNQVNCVKHRDLSTGKIELEVLNPEICDNENCVIIDDICDGGATFNAIASQIRPKHLTLIVTHGIFSKGFTELKQYFNEIIVSNSYRENYDSTIVKMVKW